jgi:hypothetical protein
MTTNETDTLADARAAAMDAAVCREALHVLRNHTEASEPLRRALEIVWDGFHMDTLISEAEREADLAEATSEYEIRARAAGVANRAARCVCGHSGSVGHADTLTDDERLPCRADGCLCDDVVYAS